jgi:Ca2+-transporting ATPase
LFQLQPPFNPQRTELNRVIDDMAQDSLRALCLAYRDLAPGECPENEEAFEQWEIPEGGLTCAAIVGIKDPCRPGVLEAVAKCQAAGVTVRRVEILSGRGDSVHLFLSFLCSFADKVHLNRGVEVRWSD